MVNLAPRRLATGVARAGILGAITLIDPNTLTGWRKQLYWLAMSGVTAAEMLADNDQAVRGSGAQYQYPDPAAISPGMAVGVAGLTYGAQDFLARADAWTMNAVSRLGAEHPRRWLAGLTAAGSLAVTLLTPDRAAEDWLLDEDHPRPDSDFDVLPDDVRGVVVTMLEAVDGYGADELRQQLAGARSAASGAVVDFQVAEDAPRTLIDFYTFPVTASFERAGRTHMFTLEIQDGRLGYLAQYTVPELADRDPEPDWSMPPADELTCQQGSRRDA